MFDIVGRWNDIYIARVKIIIVSQKRYWVVLCHWSCVCVCVCCPLVAVIVDGWCFPFTTQIVSFSGLVSVSCVSVAMMM